MTDLVYSNPRMEFITDDWPSGSHRVRAEFRIEQFPGKERCVRTTTHPITGRPNAPKKLTYSTQQRIVDGSDGKIYIACWTALYGSMITIARSDMQFQHETIHPTEGYGPAKKTNPRFDEVFALFAPVGVSK